MNLTKAKLSMSRKQYDSAVKYFRAHVYENPNAPLSVEELSSLSEAYNCLLPGTRDRAGEVKSYFEGPEMKADECGDGDVTSTLDDARGETVVDVCTEIVAMIDENLLRNARETREKVFVHKMKGDCCRYVWEVNRDPATCDEATRAYCEAIGMCKWNFEPIDPHLLEIATIYAVHLNNANDANGAILVLKNTINNAMEYLENGRVSLTETNAEPFLIRLNDYLERFQDSVEPIEISEESDPGIIDFDGQLSDNLIVRRRG